MKVVLTAIILVTVYRCGAALKCIQGKDGTAAATDCDESGGAVTKCNQPKFIEYTGLAAGEYGCGECATDKAATCETCETDGCNAPKKTAASFKCNVWEWKTDKWTQKDKTTTTCQRLEKTAIKCHSPGEKADKTYTFSHGGCGPCDAADKKAEKCTDCDKAECNSAAQLTALLLPVLAALYTLL